METSMLAGETSMPDMEISVPNQLSNADFSNRDMFYDIFSYSVSEDHPLHWHNYYEMHYVQSGHATQVVNGVAYELKPGSMALLSPVEFHCFENVSPADPLQIISIRFSDLILPLNIRGDIYNQSRTMVSYSEEAASLFRKLHEEFTSDHYGRDTYITAGIMQLCVILLRDFVNQPALNEVTHHTPIQQALLYVRAHYRSSVTVEDVAKLVHLTPNYFSEYFKKQTGVKFSSYVQKLRLEFAIGLLKMSDVSVKEVAEQSGFNSAAYFSNAFKDAFGVSPEQFRKQTLRAIIDPQRPKPKRAKEKHIQ